MLKMGALCQILDSCPDTSPSGFATVNMQSGLNLGARVKGVIRPTGFGRNRAASRSGFDQKVESGEEQLGGGGGGRRGGQDGL